MLCCASIASRRSCALFEPRGRVRSRSGEEQALLTPKQGSERHTCQHSTHSHTPGHTLGSTLHHCSHSTTRGSSQLAVARDHLSSFASATSCTPTASHTPLVCHIADQPQRPCLLATVVENVSAAPDSLCRQLLGQAALTPRVCASCAVDKPARFCLLFALPTCQRCP
jgi:hypothetical protein